MKKLNRCSILIVEEDLLAAMVLGHIVQDEGGIPILCPTAKQAILAVEQGRVAAAILDEALPQADVCGELEQRDIPFVLHRALAEVHGGSDDQSTDALIAQLAASLDGVRGRATS